MEDYYSPVWPDESLLDSVFGSLGITPDGTVNIDKSDIEQIKLFSQKLMGHTEPPNIIKMNRNFGQQYDPDEIKTKALMDFYHKHSNLTGDELQKLVQSEEGQRELQDLENQYKDKYTMFKNKDGEFYQPGQQVNLQQRNDLARYFMRSANDRMHQLIHGTYYGDDESQSVKKTRAVSDEFDALYNNILPKLLLLRKLKYIQNQQQLMEQYKLDHNHLAQFIVKLMNDAEKEMKEYLNKGVLISPLMGQHYLKLYMNK
jgi:hypothetical protein